MGSSIKELPTKKMGSSIKELPTREEREKIITSAVSNGYLCPILRGFQMKRLLCLTYLLATSPLRSEPGLP
jgi:hypothetical protein